MLSFFEINLKQPVLQFLLDFDLKNLGNFTFSFRFRFLVFCSVMLNLMKTLSHLWKNNL